jgi:hypothetical protein
MARVLTVLGVPEGFPCYMAALHSLPAAIEKRAEEIRIDKRGHACDFMVSALSEELRTKVPARDRGLCDLGTVRSMELMGSTFDEHTKNWPVGVSLRVER